MTELTFKKQATPSSTRFLAEYVAEGTDYSVTKEEGTFNGITWVARFKGTEVANFARLMDAKRRCSDHAEDEKVKAENAEIQYAQAMAAHTRPHETLNASDAPERDDRDLDGGYDPRDAQTLVGKSFKLPTLPHFNKLSKSTDHTAELAYDMSYPPIPGSAHMPNSERVQKYARANGTKRLTSKQMRRVRKNANKHNEGFMYSAGSKVYFDEITASEGYSHIGTTPEGLGIFHQFSH